MNALFARIKKGAVQARREEGIPDTNETISAFELWEKVFIDCIEFEDAYHQCPHIVWAKKLGLLAWMKQHSFGFLLGVIASIVAALGLKLCGL